MDQPRSISPSTSTSSRADSVDRGQSNTARVTSQSKAEDSGTESDQMEKAAVSNPSTVSENEEPDESLDESILAQGPSGVNNPKEQDDTLENED